MSANRHRAYGDCEGTEAIHQAAGDQTPNSMQAGVNSNRSADSAVMKRAQNIVGQRVGGWGRNGLINGAAADSATCMYEVSRSGKEHQSSIAPMAYEGREGGRGGDRCDAAHLPIIVYMNAERSNKHKRDLLMRSMYSTAVLLLYCSVRSIELLACRRSSVQ